MSENNEKTVLATAEVKDKPQTKTVEKTEKTVKTDKKKKEKKAKKRPFGEMISELKKVSWPTKADLKTYAISVIVFVVVCSVLLALMDLGVSWLVDYISKADGLPSVLNGWFNIGG